LKRESGSGEGPPSPCQLEPEMGVSLKGRGEDQRRLDPQSRNRVRLNNGHQNKKKARLGGKKSEKEIDRSSTTREMGKQNKGGKKVEKRNILRPQSRKINSISKK